MAMTPSANKLTKTLKLKGTGRVDNKGLAAGALTARSNLSSESADNGLNLEVRHSAVGVSSYAWFACSKRVIVL